jgi:hypothetical protein
MGQSRFSPAWRLGSPGIVGTLRPEAGCPPRRLGCSRLKGLRRPSERRTVAMIAQLTAAQAKAGRVKYGKRPRAKPTTRATVVPMRELVRHARALGLIEDDTTDVDTVNRAARRKDKTHPGFQLAAAVWADRRL